MTKKTVIIDFDGPPGRTPPPPCGPEGKRAMNQEISEQIDVIEKIHQWLDNNRERLHAKDCSYHRPDARCSCGLHRVLTDLGLSVSDLKVLAGLLPERIVRP